MLDDTSLDHWRQNPCEFIEQFLVDPEINKPYKLLAAERLFLQHMFTLDADGRLLYSTSIYSAIKWVGMHAEGHRPGWDGSGRRWPRPWSRAPSASTPS